MSATASGLATADGVVVVGAGECGCRAAFALREEGFAGLVTLVGDEPHPPYERPPLSKDLMSGEGGFLARTVADEARFAEHGIRHVREVAATRIDRAARRLELSDGSILGYGALVLATGAASRRLPGTEPSSRRILTLRTFDDAVRIRSHLVPGARLLVVGGGFIGLELAASAVRLGCTVTVIEAQERILKRGVPEEIAERIAARHRSEGVELMVGNGIVAVAETASEVRLELADGRAPVGDLAVVGIGSAPRTELADASGLPVANGIVVDDRLRTLDPSIYAAGDCCSFPLDVYGGIHVRLESWRSALEHGAHVARSILGTAEPLANIPWFWSEQYDLTLQVAGLPHMGTTTVRRVADDGSLLLFHLDDEGRLVAASGIGSGNAVARDVRLAEMLIRSRATPPAEALASPKTKLKALLVA